MKANIFFAALMVLILGLGWVAYQTHMTEKNRANEIQEKEKIEDEVESLDDEDLIRGLFDWVSGNRR